EAAQHMQEQENPLLPWQDSLASQRWQMELALLRLYCEPIRAARQLARLADDALREELHERRAVYSAADYRSVPPPDDPPHLYRPWRFRGLPGLPRYHLRQLGFAGGLFEHAPAPLKGSPRLVLAGTTLVLLALTAFGAAVYRWCAPHLPHLLPQEAIYNHPVL